MSQVDDPETQYDESEAPVNLAYPVSLSAVSSTDLATQVRCPVTISRRQQMVGKHGSAIYGMKGERVTHTPSVTPGPLLSVTLLDGTPNLLAGAATDH